MQGGLVNFLQQEGQREQESVRKKTKLVIHETVDIDVLPVFMRRDTKMKYDHDLHQVIK